MKQHKNQLLILSYLQHVVNWHYTANPELKRKQIILYTLDKYYNQLTTWSKNEDKSTSQAMNDALHLHLTNSQKTRGGKTWMYEETKESRRKSAFMKPQSGIVTGTVT